MKGILGLNHGKLGGMRPGFIMCLWSDGEIEFPLRYSKMTLFLYPKVVLRLMLISQIKY
jgi:hypothetical protein